MYVCTLRRKDKKHVVDYIILLGKIEFDNWSGCTAVDSALVLRSQIGSVYYISIVFKSFSSKFHINRMW